MRFGQAPAGLRQAAESPRPPAAGRHPLAAGPLRAPQSALERRLRLGDERPARKGMKQEILFVADIVDAEAERCMLVIFVLDAQIRGRRSCRSPDRRP